MTIASSSLKNRVEMQTDLITALPAGRSCRLCQLPELLETAQIPDGYDLEDRGRHSMLMLRLH